MQTYQESLEIAKKFGLDPSTTFTEYVRHMYYIVRRELAYKRLLSAQVDHDFYTAKLNEDLKVLDLRHDLENL